MATLPQGTTLANGVTIEAQPSLTFIVDPNTNTISGTADGYTAVVQAVQVILGTERFRWQIYSPYFGVQFAGLLGNDPGYVISELQRRIKDAFSVDDRILGIQDFSYSQNGDSLTVSFTVQTVYGNVGQTLEVTGG